MESLSHIITTEVETSCSKFEKKSQWKNQTFKI